ncbi:MAG TPA: cysteine-rich CWC family protein [Phnomibacter sp.]|mgnify:CR=1 FL=1|nr:cysteine-rich CWC family protein [Phnomibacter sp.]
MCETNYQKHASSTCPRCGQAFACLAGNITQCHCYAIRLPPQVQQLIATRYTDCLCQACLLQLQQPAQAFKEQFLTPPTSP